MNMSPQDVMNRVGRHLARHNITVLTVVLASAAACYYCGAYRLRAKTKYSNPEAFSDGDEVVITEVIDGDDVLIRGEGGEKTRTRILGIDTFSPTLSDPLLSEYGKICVQHLRARAKGRKALLRIPQKQLGNTGRLLGTLFLKEEGREEPIDIGLDLVRKGYALVYTRYPFTGMDAYLAVESEARAAKSGFWSDPNVTARAAALKMLWAEERGNGSD
jgi:endonuclease YncB( thermonuclease family)